jgi:hypothetical protein
VRKRWRIYRRRTLRSRLGDLALGPQALEVAPDPLQVVGQAIDPQRLGITVAEDGGGDGVLVDLESDPEVEGRWHGAGLLLLAT